MTSSTRKFKALAVFGVVAFLFLIVAPIGIGIYSVKEVKRYAMCQNRSELDNGCKPGPFWSTFSRFSAENEVLTEDIFDNSNDEGEIVESMLVRNTGESCGDNIGYCKVGDICLHDESTALDVCSASGQESPFVLSLNLDGMSLDKGKYVAEVDQEVGVKVQAMNADSVSIVLKGVKTELDRDEGGQFTGNLLVPMELDGELLVLAKKESEIAAMSVKVVSF